MHRQNLFIVPGGHVFNQNLFCTERSVKCLAFFLHFVRCCLESIKGKISKGYSSVPLLFYVEKQKVPSAVLTFTSLLICVGDQGGSSTQHCLGSFFSTCTCSNLSGLSIPSAKQLNGLILPLQPLLCQVLPSIMTTLVPFYKLIFKFLLNFQ